MTKICLGTKMGKMHNFSTNLWINPLLPNSLTNENTNLAKIII